MNREDIKAVSWNDTCLWIMPSLLIYFFILAYVWFYCLFLEAMTQFARLWTCSKNTIFMNQHERCPGHAECHVEHGVNISGTWIGVYIVAKWIKNIIFMSLWFIYGDSEESFFLHFKWIFSIFMHVFKWDVRVRDLKAARCVKSEIYT